MTVTSNPRILILGIVVLAMFGVAVLGFVLLSLAFGLIFLAVAVYLSYQLLKFARSHLASRIRTGDDGIAFDLPTNEHEEFAWGDITLSGSCTPTRGKPFSFVYCEGKDRLITIPREYTDFEALTAAIERQAPAFERFHLGPGVTIHEKLRERLNITPADSDSSDPPQEE